MQIPFEETPKNIFKIRIRKIIHSRAKAPMFEFRTQGEREKEGERNSIETKKVGNYGRGTVQEVANAQSPKVAFFIIRVWYDGL